MSEYSLRLPSIKDTEVVITSDEARDILIFFWPTRKSQIRKLDIDLAIRKRAQAYLIVAIDASFAIGFLAAVVEVFYGSPRAAVKKLIKKLAKKSAKHWWDHATRDDLKNPKVYEMVRQDIALKYKHWLWRVLRNESSNQLTKKRIIFTEPASGPLLVWS